VTVVNTRIHLIAPGWALTVGPQIDRGKPGLSTAILRWLDRRRHGGVWASPPSRTARMANRYGAIAPATGARAFFWSRSTAVDTGGAVAAGQEVVERGMAT